MKVISFGLGYDGVTAAACFIKDGHQVVGVDVNEAKVAAVGAGWSPVSESSVGDLLAQGVFEYRLETATLMSLRILRKKFSNYSPSLIVPQPLAKQRGNLSNKTGFRKHISCVLRQRSLKL